MPTLTISRLVMTFSEYQLQLFLGKKIKSILRNKCSRNKHTYKYCIYIYVTYFGTNINMKIKMNIKIQSWLSKWNLGLLCQHLYTLWIICIFTLHARRSLLDFREGWYCPRCFFSKISDFINGNKTHHSKLFAGAVINNEIWRMIHVNKQFKPGLVYSLKKQQRRRSRESQLSPFHYHITTQCII